MERQKPRDKRQDAQRRTLGAIVIALLGIATAVRASEFSDDLAARRSRVMDRLGPEAMLILWSAPAAQELWTGRLLGAEKARAKTGIGTVLPGSQFEPFATAMLAGRGSGAISAPENIAFIEKVQPAVRKCADIGVRIEDSFLLEESGLRHLSGALPKTIDDIEALMRRRQK